MCEYFINNKLDCRNRKCSECGYCEKIANEAVNINKQNADNVVYNLDFIKEKMIDIVKE